MGVLGIQCYAAHSPTVGDAPWSPAVDVNVGQAAIYTPVDRGFPDNGLLKQSSTTDSGWTIATLNFETLAWVRQEGQVLNSRDWGRQFRFTLSR